MEKMRLTTRRLLLIAIATALITSGLTQIIYGLYVVKEDIEIPIHAKADNTMAFNLDKDQLWMGANKPGSSLTRKLQIVNRYEHPVLVEFSADGPAEDYVSMPQNFILLQSQSKEVMISMLIPSDARVGDEITGEVRVRLLRV